jgi:hypothetical protein
MADRLADVADPRHDAVGRELEEEQLPERIRLPRREKSSPENAGPENAGPENTGPENTGKVR